VAQWPKLEVPSRAVDAVCRPGPVRVRGRSYVDFVSGSDVRSYDVRTCLDPLKIP